MAYTIEGLRAGIEHAKRNISSLKMAIDAEEKTIADYKIMIADIERSERRKAEAEANVSVEVISDGGKD